MQEEINKLKEMIDSDIERIGGIENFNNYCAAHEVITSWIDRILDIIGRLEDKK